MTTEKEWVAAFEPRLTASLARPELFVKTGFRLPYALHIASYRDETVESPTSVQRGYQTDLMIAELIGDSRDWVPRVVVEFKLGRVTTHDALTYSAKAATQKNVHPYLRYGIIIGRHPGAVPGRLIRHGQQFDFMLTLASEVLTDTDLERLTELLRDEIRASQDIGRLLSGRSDIRLVYRKWAISS